MVSGIKKRMRNSGEVLSVEAEVVYARDAFEYRYGDEAYIRHQPPALGEDRGEIVGAYAIIRLKNGEVIRDVMDRRRIEIARNQSRQKDGLMWTAFYDEGCRKTVLKHASKDAPQSSELMRLLDRDEEPPVIDDIPGLPAPSIERIEPEPPPPPPTIEQDNNEPAYTYVVTDLEGGEVPLQTPGATARALTLVFAEAARRGAKALDGARESNEGVLQELGADAPELHAEVLEDYNTRYAAAREAERRAKAPPPPPPPEPEPPPPAPPEPAAAGPARSAPAATSTAGSPGRSSTGEAERDEDIDTNEPGDLSPQDERLAEGILQQTPRDESMWIPTDKAVRGGKVNWAAWTAGLFLPKLRQMRDGTDLAFLLGDNEESLTAARNALDPATARDLEAAIAQQWKTIA